MSRMLQYHRFLYTRGYTISLAYWVLACLDAPRDMRPAEMLYQLTREREKEHPDIPGVFA